MTDFPVTLWRLYFYIASSYINVYLLGNYCDKSYKKNYIYKSSPGIWKDTISGLLPGDYQVWIRYEDGSCPRELTKVSISSNLKPIETIPILDGVQITNQSDTLYACPGNSLILSCLPTNIEFDWSVTGPNGFTSSSRNSVISHSLTTEMFGTYKISYSRPDGCHSSKVLMLLQKEGCTTSNNNLSLSQNPARIYPNPADEEIIIETHQNKVVRLEIWSIGGHLVLEESVVQTPATISLNSLSQGIYIVELYSEFGTYRSRLVKQ